MDFTLDNITRAIARECGLPQTGLVAEFENSEKNTATVQTTDEQLKFVVDSSETITEQSCVESIVDGLANDDIDMSEPSNVALLSEICDLSKLEPWIVSSYRMVNLLRGKGFTEKSLDSLLNDPVKTVQMFVQEFFIKDHDDDVANILISQCELDFDLFAQAFLKRKGGPKGYLGISGYLVTDEGFVVRADSYKPGDLSEKFLAYLVVKKNSKPLTS